MIPRVGETENTEYTSERFGQSSESELKNLRILPSRLFYLSLASLGLLLILSSIAQLPTAGNSYMTSFSRALIPAYVVFLIFTGAFTTSLFKNRNNFKLIRQIPDFFSVGAKGTVRFTVSLEKPLKNSITKSLNIDIRDTFPEDFQASDRTYSMNLCCFAENIISYVPPGKGKTQTATMLDELYFHQPRLEESDYKNAMLFIAKKQRKRSLIFLLTDLIDIDSSARAISSLDIINRHHLVVCIALSDQELSTLIESAPVDVETMFNQSVALNILDDRKGALAVASARGNAVVDATPETLNISAVNKYLQLKHEGRI